MIRFKSRRIWTTAVVAATSVLVCLTPALADIVSTGRFRLGADFRARLEADFDSQTAGGDDRDDRTRVRIRARASATYRPNDFWTLGLRLRSGSEENARSPHITVLDFDDNDTGEADFSLDRWFVRLRRGQSTAWLGRNQFPFWTQNELLWDADATLMGVAGQWMTDQGRRRFGGTAGYFSLPVDMRSSSGNLAGLQAFFSEDAALDFTLAAALYDFDATPDDPDAATLLNGNGARDYRVVAVSGRLGLKAGARPLFIGLDYMRNLEDYSASDPDPFTAANRDEDTGYVVSATFGKAEELGQWRVGYTYAHIEALAVNASYAADDWVRWGTENRTRSSDLEGHEVRLDWVLPASVTMVARLYLVESISGREDGDRFRIDFNYTF